MIGSINHSISALNAFGKKLSVTANNVANAETEDFKKSRAILQEGESGDVMVEIVQINTPGPKVVEGYNGEMVEKEMSNVDLAEEMPQAIISQRGYEVNLKMIKTEDEMLGSLIDMVG